MRLTTVFISLAVALVAAPTAAAGGWATAGLDSTPEGIAAGETWKVNIEVLQHGRTPMVDIQPAVVVKDATGEETRFRGEPTKKAGVYAAEVVFAKAGKYTYTVDDGFTNAVPHTFPPVVIGEGAGEREAVAAVPASAPVAGGGGSDGGTPWWPFALIGAVVVAAMAALALRRRGATGPATA